ncbi:MAG: DUF3696 domain-containing protein [Flavobacterium sp.]|nr:DUF3696 domain-containing protein [Flavobacterium sp.]
MIDKISFKNYKIFKEKQTLELKPITVLIGKNNTGKSAILKLPVLVSEGLKGVPFNSNYKIDGDSENTIELGTDIQDLVYNRNEAGALEFEISNQSEFIEIAYNKQYGALLYKRNEIEEDTSSKKINGFLVDGKKISELEFDIDYIEGIRVEPDSHYNFFNNNFKLIGVKGQNTYQILIEDFKSDERLVKEVSDWYKNNFENWELEIIESKLETETNYTIAIKNSKLNAINIKQAGQGIHQVLPIITRSFMNVVKPTLIVIEEPETHLHPAAHGNLAQRFVESYFQDKKKNYLIETHSKNFILRLQALVADPNFNFSNNDIAVYYVDYIESEQVSNLKRLKIDESGEFEEWPEEIFNESYRELLLLKQNQSKKDDSND